MGRISLSRRLFTALIGCWYTLASVEQVPLHPCAMHDGAAAAVAQAAVQSTVQASFAALLADAAPVAVADGHGAHAAHASPHAHHDAAGATAAPRGTGGADAAPGGGGGHDHGAGCLCIGGCDGAPPTVAAPAAPLAWLATILPLAPTLDAPGALERPAARVDVAQPFPVGPPHTA